MSSSDPIAQAVEAGDLAAFKSQMSSRPAAAQPGAYASAAKAAVRAHQPAILTECLRRGGVSARGYAGLDLALAAAKHGTAATLAPLIDDGGLKPTEEPNDHMGGTFLNFAVGYDNLAAVRYLLEERKLALKDFQGLSKGPQPPLADAATSASPTMIEYLISRGADPASTPGLLHLAMSHGRLDNARFLLERGIAGVDDVAAPTGQPGTALHCAADARKLDSVRFLLDAGADVAKKDPKGQDVLARSKYLDTQGQEWSELVTELRQRGLLGQFGRE